MSCMIKHSPNKSSIENCNNALLDKTLFTYYNKKHIVHIQNDATLEITTTLLIKRNFNYTAL